MIQVVAPAKINLGLEILGRRPDGYHQIITILQAIDLADVLRFEPAEELSLTCEGLASDDSNLVLRAARLLRAEAGVRRGAAIRLEKAIPIAAGLGGGSSDAAATLRSLNDLWCLGACDDELAALAVRLGADVPFFLRGGTQLASGIGEVLRPLPPPDLWVVLTITPVALVDKTKRLYGSLRPDDFSSGDTVRGLAAAIERGECLAGRALPSGFRRATLALTPQVGVVMNAIRSFGGLPSLCGAGPTVLTLHADAKDARSLAERLHQAGFETRVARTGQSTGEHGGC